MLFLTCSMTYPTDAQIKHELAFVLLLVAISFTTYDTTLAFALQEDVCDWSIDYWSWLLVVQILRALIPFLLMPFRRP